MVKMGPSYKKVLFQLKQIFFFGKIFGRSASPKNYQIYSYLKAIKMLPNIRL